jgi:hypothetical protein
MTLHVSMPFIPIVSEQYIGGATLGQLNADARRWVQRQLAKLDGKGEGLPEISPQVRAAPPVIPSERCEEFQDPGKNSRRVAYGHFGFAGNPWLRPRRPQDCPGYAGGTLVAHHSTRRLMLGAEGELMIASCDRIGALVMRMQSDFLDVPKLTLTLPQAQQRFGVDEATSEAVLGVLVDARVLANVNGVYARLFPRLVPTARVGASGPKHRLGQPQSQTRSLVGHAA